MSSGNPEIKGLQILNEIASRALEDDDYRQRLIDDPASVLRSAGIKVPEGVTVIVHENTEEEIHLVLPSQLEGELEIDDRPEPADPGSSHLLNGGTRARSGPEDRPWPRTAPAHRSRGRSLPKGRRAAMMSLSTNRA